MKRRAFLATALAAASSSRLFAALRSERWDDAAKVLEQATSAKQVAAAVMHVVQKKESFTRHFGKAASIHAMFLLGSISKPINVTALMTLFDQGKFQLDDRVRKYLPEFTGGGKDEVTIQHLLTHVSGLPDQLPDNNDLRKRQASLPEFVEQTIRTPLGFAPGAQYQYSSMGILLAARIGELLSGLDMLALVEQFVLRPLGMEHSAQGLGRFKIQDLVSCQMEGAAPPSPD